MLVSPVEGHRLWAPSYDSPGNPLLTLEDRVLPGVLGQGRVVVDVACGTGRWTTRLREGGANVFGVDLCEAMLRQAARKPGVAGRLLLADAGSLPIASSIADLTLCCLAIGYFPWLDRAFGELARVTRPGGRVVICDLHPARVAAGSTRSFRADGAGYEVRHFAYSVEDMLGAASLAGLDLEAQQHACFGSEEEPIFRAEGMGEVFFRLLDVPALWVASWRRS